MILPLSIASLALYLPFTITPSALSFFTQSLTHTRTHTHTHTHTQSDKNALNERERDREREKDLYW